MEVHSRRASESSPEDESRVFRLPPRGHMAGYAISLARRGMRLRLLMRKYGLDLVIVILLLLLIRALSISSTVDYSPRVSLSQIGPISGTRGVDRTYQSCLSSRSVHLINGTRLDYYNGWDVTSDSYNGSMYPDGFRVSLVKSSVVFQRMLYVPIQDYESISVSLQVEALSGSANVSLSLTPTIRAGNHSEVEVQQSQTECLVVNMSLDELKILYVDYWMWQFYSEIRISSGEQAVILVRSLDIEAHSSEILTPVSVDLQNTGQDDLLSDSHVRPAFWYLLLAVSRLDDGNRALVRARVANETLYLPVGNYSIRADWFPTAHWGSYIDYEQADFALRENQTTLLGMRLPTVRLSIELSPYIVYVSVTIRGPGHDASLFLHGMYLEQSVYLPASVGSINISVSHVAPWSREGRLDSQFEFDGSSDLRVYISYPYLVLLGVVMTYLDFGILVLLAGLVVAVMIRLLRLLTPKRTEPLLGDPGLLPFLLILLGAFMPWFRYVDPTSGLSKTVWPWLGVYAEQMRTGAIFPYQDEFWGLGLPIFALFFWVPLFEAATRIGTRTPALGSDRVVPMAFPIVLTLAMGLFLVSQGWIPEVGMWMILFSPAAFIIQTGIQRVLRVSRPASHELHYD